MRWATSAVAQIAAVGQWERGEERRVDEPTHLLYCSIHEKDGENKKVWTLVASR